jgi:hypothetical protein
MTKGNREFSQASHTQASFKFVQRVLLVYSKHKVQSNNTSYFHQTASVPSVAYTATARRISGALAASKGKPALFLSSHSLTHLSHTEAHSTAASLGTHMQTWQAHLFIAHTLPHRKQKRRQVTDLQNPPES